MKLRTKLISIILALLTTITLLAAAQTGPAKLMLEAAKKKEVVDGDLNAAIQQYKAIVAKYPKERAVVADALIHMAECYQKLGDAESRQVYERVVRDFTDQKEAVALARARLGGVAATQNAGIITRQVWTGPNVDAYGTVSPDGRVLSFTDWSTGDLSLHDLTTGQDHRLTNKGTWNDSGEFALGSAISRDGKQVAYGWELPAKGDFSEVRLMDLKGGKPRVLFANHDIESADVHDWSSDGKWLAVGLQRVDHTAQIGLISTVDGALRVLKSVDWRGSSAMAFSVDGKYLAYDLATNDDPEQRQIYVMAVDGSRETPAVAHPANDRVLGWSPDGNRLLLASDRSGLSAVWSLPVTDGKPQGEPELIKANINPKSIGLTRSGALYYSVVASGKDIYVASVDFETGKVLSRPAVVPQPYLGLNDFPQWSPDGKYLAYLSKRDPNTRNEQLTVLAIQSMETGKVRELRPSLAYLNSTYKSRPLWSPDGSFLIVTGQDIKGRGGIYRINAQDGKTVLLVTSELGQGDISAMALSPNGRTLYVSRRDLKSKTNAMFARDMQSGEEREIVRRSDLSDAAVSPDGRFVALAGFNSTAPKSASLLIFPAQGGDPRELLRVSEPETLGGFLAWSADGKFLFFRKFLTGTTRREPWRIPVEGGAARQMDLNGVVGQHPSIHPDGRHVAFAMGDHKIEIWVLENFLPALKANK